MKIDAHQHYWQFDPQRDSWIDETMVVLQRNFLPSHIHDEMKQHGFTGSVAVQAAESDEETEWLLNLAAQYNWIQKVVGWVDLTADNIDATLERYKSNKRLAGFRQILQSKPAEYLADSRFRRGIAALCKHNYTYDVLIFPQHMPQTLMLVRDFPNQMFVIDHMAKPSIRNGEIEVWEKYLRQIARCENVYCKVSGLVTEADWNAWQPSQLLPYIEVALEAFSPDRLMFGSDWPVATLAGSFGQVVDVAQSSLEHLSPGERQMIMGGTASRFYGIYEQ